MKSTNHVITEKDFPVQPIWGFKMLSILIFFAPFFFLVRADLLSVALVVFLVLVWPGNTDFLLRRQFHFALEEDSMVLEQGLKSKQRRAVPYGVMRNISINRDVLDKIFGLVSLTIEDASQREPSRDDDNYMSPQGTIDIGTGYRRGHEAIGFRGSRIHIPGLKRKDAEELKAILLQRVNESLR